MTLPRLASIAAHWEKVPPLAVSAAAIAAALGVKRDAPAPTKKQDPQALFDALGGGGFSMEKPTWLTAATTK